MNGLQGIVKATGPDGPTVDFDNGIKATILPMPFHYYQSREGAPAATREQIPLKLAFALTVHRAQGQTIKRVIIDCTGFFRPGQVGVAVGRAVNKEGLQIINYSHKHGAIQHPPEVYRFYENSTPVLPNPTLECCSTNHDSHQSSFSNCESTSTSRIDHNSACSSNTTSTIDRTTASTINHSTTQMESFPWEAGKFLSTLAHFTDSNFPSQDLLARINASTTLPHFLNALYTKCKELMGKPKADYSSIFTSLNAHALSHEFMADMKNLFGTSSISKAENKICCRMLMKCMDTLISEKVSPIVQEQLKEAEAVASEQKGTTLQLSAPIRRKIRYIAGACVKHVKVQVEKSLSSKLHIATEEARVSRASLYRQQRFLSSLRIHESEVTTTTADPESLGEVESKQGQSHGLTHVSDEAFDFFLALYLSLQPKHSAPFFHLYDSELFNHTRSLLFKDDDLLKRWFALFPGEEATPHDPVCAVEVEMIAEMKLDMYHQLVEYFMKISFSENLFNFKIKIPKKKKQALRPMLQSKQGTGQKRKRTQKKAVHDQEKKRQPEVSTDMSPQSASDSEEAFCGKCKTPSEWNPTDPSKQSIQCDKCQQWYHYGCVHIKGKESFLKKVNSKWLCPTCGTKNKDHGKK